MTKDEDMDNDGPDECAQPIEKKGHSYKAKLNQAAENADGWNPLSTPQRGLDRCPSVLNKPENGLEILD